MKTMKFKFFLFLSVFAPFFVACEPSDDEPEVVIPKISTGAYILNQGKYGNNNASLSYYNFADSVVTDDIFSAANNRGLGDTGQDIMIYGSKLYIAVYKSSLLEVVDLKTGKSIKTIPLVNDTNAPRSPRSLASHDGKVYVTLYDGHVSRIDTATFVVERTVKVGANPEGIVVANNLIYVANSGGMAAVNDSTISVIDIATFDEVRKIKVVINPDRLLADSKGNVYVISNGNYGYGTPAIYYTLQCIEVGTEKVTTIAGYSPQKMTIHNDQLYFYSFDSNYSTYLATNKKFVQYDVIKKTVVKESFITNDPTTKLLYSLDIDPTNGDIYIAETDFKNTGKMNVFTKDGATKTTFSVGLNAAKTVFVTK